MMNHEDPRTNQLRRVREKLGLSLRQLANKLGVSIPQLSQLERGKAKWRPLYRYALTGIQAEALSQRVKKRYITPRLTPPHNRQEIKCPHMVAKGIKCNQIMDRLSESKDPASGARIWRMICRGTREEPHQSIFVWVDFDGKPCSSPPKSRRRRLAPFERRLGPAKCTECAQTLQYQETVNNRAGYRTLYSYRCDNGKCSLRGKRVYRDPSGAAVAPLKLRVGNRKLRTSDFCPVCKGRLWRTGTQERKPLVRLRCRNRTGHIQEGIQLPVIFYYRPGEPEMFVFGRERRADGSRELMRLSRWEEKQRTCLLPADYIASKKEWFSPRQFADSTGFHEETARQYLRNRAAAGKLETKEGKRRKRYYRASP